MFILARILMILGCIPLAVLPGLCTCKAGVECAAAQEHHSTDPDSHESCCPAIEVENSVAYEPAFQLCPAEQITFIITTAVEAQSVSAELARFTFTAPPPIWPPGPPLYISHCSFVI